jgi:hypothetical protein
LIGGLCARLSGVSPLLEQDTPSLLQALARVPDPRDPRGRIHPLPGLLVMAIAAVASGSSRVVEIVEWAADLPDVVWDRLGAARDALTGARRVPDDSTLSRVLSGVDADALDAAVCGWLLGRAGLAGAGRRVIAVDGKTLRGSGPAGAQVHLLAALDQAEQIVLAQIDVAGKTNEISRFVPLLDGLDLAGAIITADCLCRRRHNASYEDFGVMPTSFGRSPGQLWFRWCEVGIIPAGFSVVLLPVVERSDGEKSGFGAGQWPVGAVRGGVQGSAWGYGLCPRAAGCAPGADGGAEPLAG